MRARDRLRGMTRQHTEEAGENRRKQIFVGGAILFIVSALTVTFLLFGRFIPGVVGESFRMLAGVISTPFFMEASFFMLGVVIVVALNAWRRHREGDEFVTIEQMEFDPQRLNDGKPSND